MGYRSIASPPSMSAASRIASGRVGCAWTVRPISWNVASRERASESSAIMSGAPTPRMWHPITSPYFASAIILTNPSVCPEATAFPRAVKGNLATLYSIPRRFASSSDRPIVATSGRQ